jgi:hypothetical protein
MCVVLIVAQTNSRPMATFVTRPWAQGPTANGWAAKLAHL